MLETPQEVKPGGRGAAASVLGGYPVSFRSQRMAGAALPGLGRPGARLAVVQGVGESPGRFCCSRQRPRLPIQRQEEGAARMWSWLGGTRHRSSYSVSVSRSLWVLRATGALTCPSTRGACVCVLTWLLSVHLCANVCGDDGGHTARPAGPRRRAGNFMRLSVVAWPSALGNDVESQVNPAAGPSGSWAREGIGGSGGLPGSTHTRCSPQHFPGLGCLLSHSCGLCFCPMPSASRRAQRPEGPSILGTGSPGLARTLGLLGKARTQASS